MPSFRRRVTAAELVAGGRIANVLAGSEFEFPDRPSSIAVAITQPAVAAMTQGQAEATVQFGSEVQIKNAHVATESVAGSGPQLPENIIAEDVATVADRIIVELNEVGGADPAIVDVYVRFTPIA